MSLEKAWLPARQINVGNLGCRRRAFVAAWRQRKHSSQEIYLASSVLLRNNVAFFGVARRESMRTGSDHLRQFTLTRNPAPLLLCGFLKGQRYPSSSRSKYAFDGPNKRSC